MAFALRVRQDHSIVRPMTTFLPVSAVSFRPTARRMSTSGEFLPGAPPSTNGTPVFKDIDFTTAKNPLGESAVRNGDPKAVFVVTGASRGLGLEFVKQLVHRTKVRLISSQLMKTKAKGGKSIDTTIYFTGSDCRLLQISGECNRFEGAHVSLGRPTPHSSCIFRC